MTIRLHTISPLTFYHFSGYKVLFYCGFKIYIFWWVIMRKAWQPTPVFLPGEPPWIEEPGGLQSMGSQRVGHDWVPKHSTIVLLDFNILAGYLDILFHDMLEILKNIWFVHVILICMNSQYIQDTGPLSDILFSIWFVFLFSYQLISFNESKIMILLKFRVSQLERFLLQYNCCTILDKL